MFFCLEYMLINFLNPAYTLSIFPIEFPANVLISNYHFDKESSYAKHHFQEESQKYWTLDNHQNNMIS